MASFGLAIFISGSGSNFKAIEAAIREKRLAAQILLVLADRDCAGLIYAKRQGYNTALIKPCDYISLEAWDAAVLEETKKFATELIVLAGFLRKIGKKLLAAYPRSIVNIHPSLLPSHGGPGFYGIRPHQAAIDAGDKEAGATVHYIDEHYDRGEIILQRSIEILPGETAPELQKRVLEEIEWKIYAEALAKVITERQER